MDILYSRLVLWLSSPKGAKFGQSEPTFNNVVVNLSLGSPRSGIVDKVVNIVSTCCTFPYFELMPPFSPTSLLKKESMLSQLPVIRVMMHAITVQQALSL